MTREIRTDEQTVIGIYGELGAAISQSLPSDDQIIMEHVRAAHSALGRLLSGAIVSPRRKGE